MKLHDITGLSGPWLLKWRMKINTEKCKVTLCPVKIFNEKTKYLGMTLD
jgi:hypothetical protein